MTRRLFLFAAYDAHGIIDNALIYYVRALSKLGDVVLVMDSDADEKQLNKIKPYVLYANASRHGEYDFGSYKRAYTYARDNDILNKYDVLYLVNDSVYGPLHDLHPIITDLESRNLGAFGLVCNPHRDHPHIQSWFIGCDKSVFMSEWFDKFMRSVTKLPDKGMITKLYEQGFTKNLIEQNISWYCPWNAPGRSVYNNVAKLYKRGMPFLKKNAFNRMHGGLGMRIAYIMRHIPPTARDAILQDAKRVYGHQHVDWLLTRNPIKIIYRNIRHATAKLFTGKL